MNPVLNTMDSKSSSFIENICREYAPQHAVPAEKYEKYGVKRGLRNSDGTGVMAGITQIGNVKGYYMQDGEKLPAPGQLVYRGYNVEDLIRSFVSEGRFGYEETAYLLLFGSLPNKEQLDTFHDLLVQYRTLPANFTEDMILKAPSSDVMNKLARATLALYSYDEDPENNSLEYELYQAMTLIARYPVIVAHAFACKRHYFDNESLYLHRPSEDLSVAENFLYSIRPNNQFTEEEARLLLDSLVGYDVSYPVVFDWERIGSGKARTDEVTGKSIGLMARAFCGLVAQAGYTPGVYFNQNLGYLSLELEQLEDCVFWLAEYDASPDFHYHADLWQYSSTGRVPGIEVPVDLNLSYRDFGQPEG